MAFKERKKAKGEGKSKYFTGVPCVNGHIAERHTSNSQCVVCKNNFRIKRIYGITEAEYNNLLWLQNGVCAICRKKETVIDGQSKKIKPLAIDHCGKTGRVRGLLCHKCNVGIGSLQHDPELLHIAALYCKL